ncbi:MAG: pirin family protein [Candidatus Marinimicrobia bacterium]|nr:pirin family protein [Candidatus Neomarinimicrobiota bacterium]
MAKLKRIAQIVNDIENFCLLSLMYSMNSNYSRRTLLKIITGGVFSIVSLLFSKNRNLRKLKKMGKDNHSILSIKELPETGPWPTVDPFLFCVHHNDNYPAAKDDLSPNVSLSGRYLGNDFSNKDGWSMYHGQKVPGFPRHPHRGFETLTVVSKGFIDHADSLGASARYGDGDAQWLTAGDGINHSEMFPLFSQNRNNKLDFFQIWLNLPSYNKRVEPNFEMYWKDEIPKVSNNFNGNKNSQIEIITGDYLDFSSPIAPKNSWANNKKNDVAVWIIRLDRNGKFAIPDTKSGANRNLYVLKDSNMEIDGQSISGGSMVTLDSSKNTAIKNLGSKTKILMLQGVPINEPVVKYGPFVMNTRSEIEQAFYDYNRTEFGGWKWGNSDPVHGIEKEKFAKLINGNITKPS